MLTSETSKTSTCGETPPCWQLTRMSTKSFEQRETCCSA